MKKVLTQTMGMLLLSIFAVSCKRDAGSLPNAEAQLRSNRQTSNCPEEKYRVTLLENNVPDGAHYRWTWKVENLNPGNGNNCTVQDLSNWGFKLSTCPMEAGVPASEFVRAGFSSNGTSWNYFIPSFQVNPSQSCMTDPVLKFDFGTNGSNPSYFRVYLNSIRSVGSMEGYYKSGNKTGCGVFVFEGILTCEVGKAAIQ